MAEFNGEVAEQQTTRRERLLYHGSTRTEAAKLIAAAVDPDANIIFGATIDEQMVDQVKITVIATGFDETKKKLQDLSTKVEDVTSDRSEKVDSSLSIGEQDQEEDEWDIPAFLRQGKN